MKKNNTKNFRNIVYTALFAAMICVAIMSIRFPIPGRGFYHTGDAFIYLAAVCLPFPYAIAAAAVGGALSDLFVGYQQYMLATFIIKGLMAFCFTSKTEKILCAKNIIGAVAASIIMIFGYYLTEVVLLILTNGDNLAVALTGAMGEIPGNITQAISSGVIFIVLAIAMDKIALRQKLFKKAI